MKARLVGVALVATMLISGVTSFGAVQEEASFGSCTNHIYKGCWKYKL